MKEVHIDYRDFCSRSCNKKEGEDSFWNVDSVRKHVVFIRDLCYNNILYRMIEDGRYEY